MSAAIAFAGLSVRFGTAEVVRGISAEVERGEWIGLIGPNGAGKTTVLRAVAGLVPYDGRLSLEGHEVRESRRRDIARRLALVPQSPHIPPELTVAEYVLLGRTAHIAYLAMEGRSDRIAAQRALERLELEGFAERTLGSLSGGELQRAVLARALAQEAPVLLLDEPTSALDLGHQQQALELVDLLRHEHALTVIAAMHDLTLAAQYSDRLLLLDGGRIVADGPAGEVLSEERIAEHYGARVQIVRENGSIAVLPRRQAH